MRVLIVHRDSGSRQLIERLKPLLADMELIDSPPGEPVGPLDGVAALLAIGKVDRATMQQGQFRFIQGPTTGYDHIDLAAAKELGIRVAHVPASVSGNAESVAELAMLLILALSRRLQQAQANLRERRWAQPLGAALLGKTACVVGLGAIGLPLVKRLQAFDMKLTATRRDPAKGAPAGVTLHGSLTEAARDADYVILCARADASNAHLVNAETLAAFKKGVYVINVARGSLVDHDALLASLQAGHVAGAGLDVFWQEPVDPNHPLFALNQVIATPHIAGVTDLNIGNTLRIVADNLQRYARGEEPLYLID
jgi:phosphoglycerate dehydrogenase-like enzyme